VVWAGGRFLHSAEGCCRYYGDVRSWWQKLAKNVKKVPLVAYEFLRYNPSTSVGAPSLRFGSSRQRWARLAFSQEEVRCIAPIPVPSRDLARRWTLNRRFAVSAKISV